MRRAGRCFVSARLVYPSPMFFVGTVRVCVLVFFLPKRVSLTALSSRTL